MALDVPISGLIDVPASSAFDVRLDEKINSFTFRFWVKITGGFADAAIGFIRGPTFPLGSYWCVNSIGGSTTFYCPIPFASPATADWGEPPQRWHHVVCGFDGSANKSFVLVDNGARAFSFLTFGAPAQLGEAISIVAYKPVEIFGGIGTPELDRVYFDEFGLWKGYVWTDADVANDWNGGAGRTYPDVPSNGLAAYYNMDALPLIDEVGGVELVQQTFTNISIGTGIIGGCVQIESSSLPFDSTYFRSYDDVFDVGESFP